MTPAAQLGHWLGTTFIPVPSGPILAAGYVPPCWVQRLDRRVWITTEDGVREPREVGDE